MMMTQAPSERLNQLSRAGLSGGVIALFSTLSLACIVSSRDDGPHQLYAAAACGFFAALTLSCFFIYFGARSNDHKSDNQIVLRKDLISFIIAPVEAAAPGGELRVFQRRLEQGEAQGFTLDAADWVSLKDYFEPKASGGSPNSDLHQFIEHQITALKDSPLASV